MTELELQNAIIETIADEVVKRVKERLIAMRKKAIVVCTGSGLAFPEWLAGLKRLENEGFSFDLFLSDSAWRVLDVDALCKAISFGKIWGCEGDPPAEVLVGDYPTVIVPALTINTASKLAACMPDTPVSRLLFTAVAYGKTVVIAVDGCCPDNAGRAEKGYAFVEPLKEHLRGNLVRIKDFGAYLATADSLAEKTLKAIGVDKTERVTSAEAAAVCEAPSIKAGGRRVISRQDIALLPPGSTYRVPRGSMVTQLAADDARIRGVILIKDEV